MKLHLPKVLGAALLAALATSAVYADGEETPTYGWSSTGPTKDETAISYAPGTETVGENKTLTVTGDGTAYSYTEAYYTDTNSNKHLQIISAAGKDIKLSGGAGEFLRNTTDTVGTDTVGSVTANSLWLTSGTYGIGTGNYSKLNSLQALYITNGGQLYGAAGGSGVADESTVITCPMFIADGGTTSALDVVSSAKTLTINGLVTLVGDASITNVAGNGGSTKVVFDSLALSGNTFTVKDNQVTITDTSLGSGTLKRTGGTVTLASGLEIAQGETLTLEGSNITICGSISGEGTLSIAAGASVNLDLDDITETKPGAGYKGFSTLSCTLGTDVTVGEGATLTFRGLALTASAENPRMYSGNSTTYYFNLGQNSEYTVASSDESLSTVTAYVIQSGTVKLDTAIFTGDAHSTENYVQIDSGATFDINGKNDGKNGIVLNGGTLTNTGNNAYNTNNRQLAGGIALKANSYIDGTGGLGIVGSGYAAVTVDLGGYTLQKQGTNAFTVYNTTVRGGGTLKITQGSFVFDGNSYLGHSDDQADTNVEMTGGLLGGTVNLNRNATFTISGTEASITANMALGNQTATVNLASNADAVTMSGKVSGGTLQLTGAGTLTLGYTTAVNNDLKLYLTRGSTMKINAGVSVSSSVTDGLRFLGAASGEAAKLVISKASDSAESGKLVYDGFTYTADGAENGMIVGRTLGSSGAENMSLYETAFSSISNLTLDLTTDAHKTIGGSNADRGYLDNVTIRNTSAVGKNVVVQVAARNLTLENRNTATMSYTGTNASRSGTMSLINDGTSNGVSSTGKITDAGTSAAAASALGAFTGYGEVKAATGAIEMQNLGSEAVSVETLTIAAGQSVTALQAGTSSSAATLTLSGQELSVTGSGAAATLSANLILGGTAISLEQGQGLSINGSLTLGSGNTLSLGSSAVAALAEEGTRSWVLFTATEGVYYDGALLTENTKLCVSNVFSDIENLAGWQDCVLTYDAAAKTLTLTTPEPTTATLSLLALVGLAARRRRR